MFNKPSLITTKELTNKNSKSLFIGGKNCSYKVRSVKILVLEGDHTQNPPNYFEGLKSVGDGVDEIVVSSVNENLFDLNTVNQDWGIGTFNTIESTTDKGYHSCIAFDVESYRGKRIYPSIFRNGVCLANYVSFLVFFNENKKVINRRYGHKSHNSNYDEYIDLTQGIVVPHNAKYCRLMHYVVKGTLTNGYVQSDKYALTLHPVVIGEIISTHKQDKKRLLYYNNETQTWEKPILREWDSIEKHADWEKPILREWDSIEKHADGKYYYHQRSGEVVLNGSEDWKPNSINTVFYNNVKLLGIV